MIRANRAASRGNYVPQSYGLGGVTMIQRRRSYVCPIKVTPPFAFAKDGPPSQTLRSSCETEWSEECPAHAAAAWLGHGEAVARKHYLQVPLEWFDRAAGIGAERPSQPGRKISAKCAAANPRKDSHSLATGTGATNAAHLGNPTNAASNALTATSGARDRTGDLGIMKPTL